MTLEEKAGMCSGKDNWHLKSVERLGIPEVMVSDGPHGLRKQEDKTDHLGLNGSKRAVCFPAACASACSFDRGLLQELGEAIGEECQAEDVSIVLGPAVNIKRSPLCGRNFEYFSEDPYLASELAKSYISGVQSKQVGTSIKHFAVNNQEFRRMSCSSELDERALREIYLSAFEAAVKEAKPWTVMCSYNRINGVYASENKKLLSDILRDEWGFDGYPSVGLSAIVTDLLPETMRQSISPVLGFLKVRASYTEVGSPIPYTGLTPGTITHTIEGGVIKPFKYYPLPELKPERTRSYEVGIDSKWLNNTVSLGVTLYKSNTYDQLLEAKLSETSGYDYMFVQAGNVENRGIELTLGYDQTFGNFSYSTSLTATANRNKIIALASNVKNPVTGEALDLSDIKVGRFRLREGEEVGTIYAEERLKRDQDGYIVYNEGQTITTESTEPYKLGSVNAKWNLGWRNGFTYKGFNLNFLVTARLGGIVISKTQAVLDQFGVSQASADARDAGKVMVGNVAVQPKDYYESVVNLDAYNVYSATNVRLQEASLGYTFPNSWFKGTPFHSVNLSVYGTNLWMIYNKAPFDPELTASTGTFGQGYDYFMLPSQRTYGVSLKFGF